MVLRTALHLTATIRAGRQPPFARCQAIGTSAMAKEDYTAADYTAMAKADYREYHQQLAARLRSAAEQSTTKAIKARLVAEAEQHERIVRGETEIRTPSDKPQEKRKRARPITLAPYETAPGNPSGTHTVDRVFTPIRAVGKKSG